MTPDEQGYAAPADRSIRICATNDEKWEESLGYRVLEAGHRPPCKTCSKVLQGCRRLFIVQDVAGTFSCEQDLMGVDMSADKALVERLVDKDATALPEFYSIYRTRILATARQMVHDEWDAEEVLQDVCWTVFRKAHQFRGEGEFWTWVHRVTQNAARMLLRKRRRIPTPVEDSDVESMLHSAAETESAARPEDVANQHFAMERMNAELQRLDPVNQRLFHAMEVDGVSKEAIADELGLSVSAVKARLHRVRRALRFAADGPSASVMVSVA